MRFFTTAILVLIINDALGQQKDSLIPPFTFQKQYDSVFNKFKQYDYYNINSIQSGYRYKTIQDDIKLGKLPMVQVNPEQTIVGKMPIEIPASVIAGAIPDMMPRTLVQTEMYKNSIPIPGKPQFFNSLPNIPRVNQ